MSFDRLSTYLNIPYLCEQLIHFTTHALCLDFTPLGTMLIAQKVSTQEGVVDEALKNHVHETSRAHIAQTTKS